MNLTVYDVLGRTVKVLVDDVLPAGDHSIAFDANALPGGVYLYTLRTGSGTATMIMSYLK